MTQEEILCTLFKVTHEQAKYMIDHGVKSIELTNGKGSDKFLDESGLGAQINGVKKQLDDIATENKVET